MKMYPINYLLLCTCFLAATRLVGSVDPTVTITETDPPVQRDNRIYAERDQDVTLTCYVENLPLGTEVYWQRSYKDVNGQNQTEPISKDTSVNDNTRYGIEKPTLFQWRLRIRSIPLAYQGVYMCYVTVQLQTKTAMERTVMVYVRPTLIPSQTSSDMVVKEGDTVDLLCNATGLPAPTITWRRVGKALLPVGKEQHIGARMEVLDIQSHHRGEYICEAENRIGKIVRIIDVDVKFKPIVTLNRRVVYQAPGYVTELQCLIEANPDPAEEELSWFKGAISMSQSSGRYKLKLIRGAFNQLTYELIIDGVEDKDYGDYRCQAINDLGMTSATVTLEKSDTPQNSVKLGMVIRGSSSQISACLSLIFTSLSILLWNNL